MQPKTAKRRSAFRRANRTMPRRRIDIATEAIDYKNPDLLKTYEPKQSDAWRRLDVAILQRYLLDEVLQPKFNGGKELTKGYTADPFAVA